jgi:hypothetical protein
VLLRVSTVYEVKGDATFNIPVNIPDTFGTPYVVLAPVDEDDLPAEMSVEDFLETPMHFDASFASGEDGALLSSVSKVDIWGWGQRRTAASHENAQPLGWRLGAATPASCSYVALAVWLQLFCVTGVVPVGASVWVVCDPRLGSRRPKTPREPEGVPLELQQPPPPPLLITRAYSPRRRTRPTVGSRAFQELV